MIDNEVNKIIYNGVFSLDMCDALEKSGEIVLEECKKFALENYNIKLDCLKIYSSASIDFNNSFEIAEGISKTKFIIEKINDKFIGKLYLKSKLKLT